MEGVTKDAGTATGLCGAIEVNVVQIRTQLSDTVRGALEETLNAMLAAERLRDNANPSFPIRPPKPFFSPLFAA